MFLRDFRRESAEQMIDFFGEAVMKKQEANLGLVLRILWGNIIFEKRKGQGAERGKIKKMGGKIKV